MDAIVDAESGFSASCDGVFRGGDWEGNVVTFWYGAGGVASKIFALDTDDTIAVDSIFVGFEKEDFVVNIDSTSSVF